MAQTQVIGKHKTKVYTANGFKIVKYHWTEVVKFNDKEIILDSNGWRTATTRSRMNQASNQFDLNFGVFQKKGEWFVRFYDGRETVPFQDEMVIKR